MWKIGFLIIIVFAFIICIDRNNRPIVIDPITERIKIITQDDSLNPDQKQKLIVEVLKQGSDKKNG